MGEGTKAYYEGFEDYGTLYDTGIWRQYRRVAASMVIAALPDRPGLRVLDLGGGALLSLRELHADPRVSDYVVVDLVVRLPAGLPKVRSVTSDILSFIKGYSGPAFDAVIFFGVLEYLSDTDAAAALRLLPALLAPDGQVLVHEPNARAAAYMTRGDGEQKTVELEALLPGTGLELIERRDYDLPRLRTVLAKLKIKSPALLRAALTFERALGGGVDSLYRLSAARGRDRGSDGPSPTP